MHIPRRSNTVALGQLIASKDSRWQQLWTIISLPRIWSSAWWLKGWVVIPWTSKCARNLIWGYCSWEDSRQSPVSCPLTQKWAIVPKPHFWGAQNCHQKSGFLWLHSCPWRQHYLGDFGRLGFNSVWTDKQGSVKRQTGRSDPDFMLSDGFIPL